MIFRHTGKSVTFELLEEHREQVATRALQALLPSRDNNIMKADLLIPGDLIWSWYNSSKQNEKNEWIATVVINAGQHYIEAKRSPNGRTMRTAYKDVRLRPQVVLTQELVSCSREHELGYDEPKTSYKHSENMTTRNEINSLLESVRNH